MKNQDLGNLIKKYNQSVARYTSYPTVPFWQDGIDSNQWQHVFAQRFIDYNATEGISLYVHLPFCESLCTYCGCNKKITTNHKVEEEYLFAIEKEWQLYRGMMGQTPVIREIHLGGGTPTFFSPRNLRRLITGLTEDSIIHHLHEFSIEGHPNNTSWQHLQVLSHLGFRRISFGVQDLDPKVQLAINRIQPFENLQRVTDMARASGFTSINFDLIYGLPFQTISNIGNTISQVCALEPDRIAFYSYAHVPWTSKAQRLFSEKDLPAAEEKIQLYIKGQGMLTAHGYHNIGMDHFSMAHDELYTAKKENRLHRNFMGYTTQNSHLQLGLGVSAISDAGIAFAQNHKTLKAYYDLLGKDMLPVQKGCFLTQEDISFRKYINGISCNGFTNFKLSDIALLKQYVFPELEAMAQDGLVDYDMRQLKLTETGRFFTRNVCSAFDLYLRRNNTINSPQTFSKAV